jgi:hypothetical protein
MKEEIQRIKIAEACGYTHVRIIKAIEGPPDIGIGHHPTEPHSVPDYLNDLNAMHEAEKVLNEKEQRDYVFRLLLKLVAGSVTNNLNDHFIFIQATATQRAEAFLKTLNLWEE